YDLQRTSSILKSLCRLDFRPDAISKFLRRRRKSARPFAAQKSLIRWVKVGIVPRRGREQIACSSVRGCGAGIVGNGGRNLWAQQVVEELMRQPGAGTFAQDHGAVAVKRKPFRRIEE